MKKQQRLFRYIALWVPLGLLLGICGGGVGVLFSLCVGVVTDLRIANGWLICLLPLAGMLSVLLYRLLHTQGMGTNQVLKSTRGENQLSPLLAPAIFIASVLSHLCGASVGREGAALQLGGSIATGVGQLFRLTQEQRRCLVYSGMAALFSALFGTPLSAFIFALEVVWTGHICLRAVFPALLASLTAYGTSLLLGGHAERFPLTAPPFSWETAGKLLLIAIASSLVAWCFCRLLSLSEHGLKKVLKNEYLRIVVGGVLLIALTALVGHQEYNGAGVPIIHRVFAEGEVHYEAFLLKMLFTCIAVGTGFKGGEIVPTLFIGATFGGAAALLLGVSPAIGAAVGLTALFCGVTNCPIASALLAVELFGGVGFGYTIPAAFIAFFLSGRISLYAAQQRDRLRDMFRK